MIYKVKHVTTYHYGSEFSGSHNQVHLVPRDTDRQSCLAWELHVDPEPDSFGHHDDAFGNHVESFSIHVPSSTLRIEARSEMSLSSPLPGPAPTSPSWQSVRDLLTTPQAPIHPVQFLFASPYIKPPPALAAYARPSFPDNRPLLAAATDLMNRIFRDFKFDPTATDVGTGVAEVLTSRRGVCQDFAHLMIGCCRSLGLAARYVSGYLITEPKSGKPRLLGADVSHAWVAVWCPDNGWIEFDPTNDLSPCDRHITIAYGRDYGDVSPVRGVVLGGGGHRVQVSVDVEPA